MSIERIQAAAFNISNYKDITDITHIKNYCNKAYGFRPESRVVIGALEEIGVYLITTKRFDLTAIYNPVESREVSIQKNSHIYFIGNLDEMICKIGTSVDVEQRLSDLQTGSPFELFLLKLIKGGGRELERIYHNEFDAYHMRGEWFKIQGDLKKFLSHDKALIS